MTARAWYTAADLADLALPGLPRVKRKVNEMAADRRWPFAVGEGGMALARPRAGRGGGLEYNVRILPPGAQAELMRRGLMPEPEAPSNVVALREPVARDSLWSWFERQSEATREEARRRMRAIDAVEAIERSGQTRSSAVTAVAAAHVVSPATVWNWLSFVTGVPRHDRLPRLAPRRQGGGAEAEVDDDAWAMFKGDYLRPEKPTYASCYARLQAYAEPRGVALPTVKTLQRKLEREVDGRVILKLRSGAEALRRSLPPQQRTVAELTALELVNIDGHKWDVFVRWPDGHIARPITVAIQDVYSRKVVGWRTGTTENVTLTRLAFGDVFRDFGIPGGCLLDNGRAFASKEMTGGAKTRFRFKIRREDPEGLLTSLGVEIHWATPYRGQSKPIERGFRDLCDHGAKHPAFAGAYTGNKPDAKPENYGSKAIDLEVFVRVVAKIMAAHNARVGRRTEAASGGSFDQAFNDSFAQHPVRKATPEHLRMALLAADQVRADRSSGAISLYGNRYWSEALSAVAGDLVTVRFDPDALHSDVHVYAQDGRYLASAPVIAATGFLDRDSAKERAKFEARHRKAVALAVELENLLSADQIAAMLPDDETEVQTPAPKVVRPVRARGSAAAAPRAQLIDRLNLEDFAPVREARAPLRLVD